MGSSKFFQSKFFKRLLLVIGILALLFISFELGLFVGYHKAEFSYEWGEYYNSHFGGPPNGIFGFPPGPEFMDAHGTFGSILSIATSTLVINGRDNMEKTVLLSSSTVIRRDRDDIRPADIKVGESVVIIGSPDSEGQLDAKLIRALP